MRRLRADMPTTSLVIGANRGIGLALCRELRARNRELIATCRKISQELEALSVRIEGGVDVTSDDSIAALAQRLKGLPIDELWCNAGILREDSLDSLDWDGVRAQLEVNAIGPLRVVRGLRGNLRRGSKI